MKRAFRQVDVFTQVPFRGNPVAVVFDAEGLRDEDMQAFARWTNLSETTFLLPPRDPAADYRVRIFAPGGEVAFAGHPTLGTCHSWLEGGGCPRADVIVQECARGLVRIRRTGHLLSFAAPAMHAEEVEPERLARVIAALGLDPDHVRAARLLDNGAPWLTLLLDSAERVLALEPDHEALRSLAEVGVAGPHPEGADCAFEVRAFADPIGIPEDPVCGSLNASLAQWLIAAGMAPPSYIASQGARLSRKGWVHIDADGDTVWVGGSTHTCIAGTVSL